MKELRARRTARGWSQSELGRQSGVNQVIISAVENGRLIPYPRQLARIGRALGIPEDEAHLLLDEVADDRA